jgi:hypothetical protein
MKTRKLFVLSNTIWDADDYLHGNNNNPIRTDIYLYATEEEAKEEAMSLDFNKEIYNDCTLYSGEISEDDILNLTGYETLEEFDEALAEPYSTDSRIKNLGEFEKGDVAQAIFENPTEERTIECSNYDFDKSLAGSVLVFWSWERYVGYARKLIEVRRATSEDTEAILTKKDKVYTTQCDVLLTAAEVEAADNLQAAIRERLENGAWKWVNTSFITEAIENI